MYINISKLDYKRYWGHGPGIRILYNLSLHIERAVQKYQKWSASMWPKLIGAYVMDHAGAPY